jgi:hypothetical protein
MNKLKLILAQILMACVQLINAAPEGQTLSYSNQNYATVGLKISGHMGKKKWASFGPEISFGHIYTDPFIASVSIGCESINIFEGAIISLRLQGGTYLIGASIGTDWIRFDHNNYWGIDLNSWVGLGAYIEGAYLFAHGLSGPSISGKGKIPFYIEEKK